MILVLFLIFPVYPTLPLAENKNDPWSLSLSPPVSSSSGAFTDPWSPATSLDPASTNLISEDEKAKKRSNAKTPESFLGENSALVNLDNLLGATNVTSKPGWFHEKLESE